jgi:hypothetical protein
MSHLEEGKIEPIAAAKTGMWTDRHQAPLHIIINMFRVQQVGWWSIGFS